MGIPILAHRSWPIVLGALLLFQQGCSGGRSGGGRDPNGNWNFYRVNDLSDGCDEQRVDATEMQISDDGQGGFRVAITIDDDTGQALNLTGELNGQRFEVSGTGDVFGGTVTVQNATWEFDGPDLMVGNLEILLIEDSGLACATTSSVRAYRQQSPVVPEVLGRYHWTLTGNRCGDGTPEAVIVDILPGNSEEVVLLLYPSIEQVPNDPLFFPAGLSRGPQGGLLEPFGSDSSGSEPARIAESSLSFDGVDRTMAGEMLVQFETPTVCEATLQVRGEALGRAPAGEWNGVLLAFDRNDLGSAATHVPVSIEHDSGPSFELTMQFRPDRYPREEASSFSFPAAWLEDSSELMIIGGQSAVYNIVDSVFGDIIATRRVTLLNDLRLGLLGDSSGDGGAQLDQGQLAIALTGYLNFEDVDTVDPNDRVEFEGDLAAFYEDGTRDHPLSLQPQTWTVASSRYTDVLNVLFVPLNDAIGDLNEDGVPDRFAVSMESFALGGELLRFLVDVRSREDGQTWELEIDDSDVGSFGTDYSIEESASQPLLLFIPENGEIEIAGQLRVTIPSLGIDRAEVAISG